MSSEKEATSPFEREIEDLFDELDELLKSAGATEILAERGVNTSLALTIADGLRAYLQGDKAVAAEELATAAEEIGARLQMSKEAAREAAKDKPS